MTIKKMGSSNAEFFLETVAFTNKRKSMSNKDRQEKCLQMYHVET